MMQVMTTLKTIQIHHSFFTQNVNEFIDQKKEMFLAELAYNTVDQEIKELEEMRKELEVRELKIQQLQVKADSDTPPLFVA